MLSQNHHMHMNANESEYVNACDLSEYILFLFKNNNIDLLYFMTNKVSSVYLLLKMCLVNI